MAKRNLKNLERVINLNVATKAIEVLDKLQKSGFGGLDVLNIKKEGVWHEEYAVFILNFDFPIYDEPDTPYTTHSFDEDGFNSDLMYHLEFEFPKCKINFSKGCSEYEIIGPKYKSFYKKNFDAIEDIETRRGMGELVIYTPGMTYVGKNKVRLYKGDN